MALYKSAQGKTVDMNALIAQNERARAVGNMKVNARGDTIDDNGKVVVPVTQKVGEKYQKTVGNRSAQVNKKPVSQKLEADKPSVKPEPVELTQEEKELEADYDENVEKQIAQIKAKEQNK